MTVRALTSTTLFFALLLAACGGPAAQTVRHGSSTPTATSSARGTDTSRTVAVAGRDTADADCNGVAVYFDYDSADLSPRMRDTLERAASCLRTHRDKRVDLVGATDPRGTEEYNLALGDRRARVVAGYLSSLGVEGTRLTVASVGEEEARGTDEASWAQDRKVAPR